MASNDTAHHQTAKTTQSRVVRIFLSSTFRDFAEERDLLVRSVFPELRRRCRERQVELVDVDLRWGITEEQSQRGQVLPICLAEIDRARPYFMGLVGERYGWIPAAAAYSPSLLQEQPWLQEHTGGKSVTELEVLHGVLNNPAMVGRALFYFRDPAYAETKGGDYVSEDADHRNRLDHLKSRIRQSGFPVVEAYESPLILAERVREDLWSLIDTAYPADEVPDALAMERRRHQAYGASRLGLYLGGEPYFEALDQLLGTDGSNTPSVITGPSGGGKSALLANWLDAYTGRHPAILLHVHHLSASSDAADPEKLAVRLLSEISRITGEELKLETESQKLFAQLPEWLARASSYAARNETRWILVMDGLDKLLSGRDLRWWPEFLPASIHLVASSLAGEALESARQRGWRELTVQPLSPAEQEQLIVDYLGRYRKALTTPQVARIQEHPLVGNPLFLRTVLEELRVFGVHEDLERELALCLQCRTVDNLFGKVLARVEADTSASDVRSAMEAIWASRAGLAQDELLQIAGLVAATWAPIHIALDGALVESGGRLTFGHDYLRKAVENRYQLSGTEGREAHRKLARHFATLPVGARVADELPWQWQCAGDTEELRACLVGREMFSALYGRDEYELLRYWLSIGSDQIEPAYEAAWQLWIVGADEKTRAGWGSGLASFLMTSGYYGDLCLRLRRQSLAFAEKAEGPEHPSTGVKLDGLAGLLRAKGDYAAAEPLSRRALAIAEKAQGPEHPSTGQTLNNLARLLKVKGDYAAAEPLYRRALAIAEKAQGPEHPSTGVILNSLAVLLEAKGDYAAAEPLFRRALAIAEKAEGPEHPSTGQTLNNLANLLKAKGDYAAAEPLYRRALAIAEKAEGLEHPSTGVKLSNLAGLLKAKGDYAAAEPLFRRALAIAEKAQGPEHPQTLTSVAQLVLLLLEAGDFSGAAELLGRFSALGLFELLLDGNLAGAAELLGRFSR